ncbi:MAG: hypothetical protein ACO3F9_13610 [Burkholderiales bacterium]
MTAQLKTIITDADLIAMVDELGGLKARIADLQIREKEIKAMLSGCGYEAIDGQQYRASIAWSDGRLSIDWRAIAEHFNPSRQLVTAHSSTGEAFATIKVSARKTS